MNTELIKKAQKKFEKNFFKLMNNSAFGKTMENHRDIKLITTYKRRKRLEPNYHSHKNIFRTFDGNRNENDKSKNS